MRPARTALCPAGRAISRARGGPESAVPAGVSFKKARRPPTGRAAPSIYNMFPGAVALYAPPFNLRRRYDPEAPPSRRVWCLTAAPNSDPCAAQTAPLAYSIETMPVQDFRPSLAACRRTRRRRTMRSSPARTNIAYFEKERKRGGGGGAFLPVGRAHEL